ncbi:hypothetical protein LZ318_03625 [Saccharopolyspora indica]|uniref:hypothetical protein n=1 Tax=Saccharopolyspora indica TaxID=1229659 RepID=UPI0022EA5037|nr:hypothetical protein [Saccharopolyspora indica]MDA3644982.1 hypothetical protein [Saccharopolyspora indica]
MTDQSLVDADGFARPLPPDPLSPVPEAVERELATYRAGDAGRAKAALTTIAESGRTAVAGHAAMALAGVELTENGLSASCGKWLEQVAAGEDPWLGPLAVVMLSSDFEEHIAGPEPLLDHLAGQLTGDRASAREGFERSLAALEEAWANESEYDDDAISAILNQRDITKLLLGNLLIQTGDSAAALEPLSSARSHCDGLLAAYAGHLEAHVLIEQEKDEPAAEVLSYAYGESIPANSGAEGLAQWIGIRYGEHLAGNPWMDIVADQVEDIPAVTEAVVVRDRFEGAHFFTKLSRPALAAIGLHLFPASADFEPVHAALERLKTWSDERHERARRLILVLHQYVEDSRDEEKTRGLAELWKRLDLPGLR